MNCFQELEECTKMGQELIKIIKEKDKIIDFQNRKIDKILDLFDLKMKEINKSQDPNLNDSFKYYDQLELMGEILKILKDNNKE
jgi:hypothetical protein